jgi:hypothetical protein
MEQKSLQEDDLLSQDVLNWLLACCGVVGLDSFRDGVG